MRKTLGSVLIALGAALLVMAPLLRFWIAPTLVTTPLNTYSESVSEAKDAIYLDLSSLQVVKDRSLRATRVVKGDVDEGTPDTAIFDVFLSVVDPQKPGDGNMKGVVSMQEDRVALDRRTAMAVNCCRESIDGQAVKHKGLTYKFPFATEARTYPYFDTYIQQATDMKFVERTQIDAVPETKGLTLLKFQQVIPLTRIATMNVPGSLIGEKEASVPVDRMYSVDRQIWVEPTTGMIIRGVEQQYSTLRDKESGKDRLTITDMTMAWTDSTIALQASNARKLKQQIMLISVYAPVGSLVAGSVLLGGGIYLFLSGTRRIDRSKLVRRKAAKGEYV